MHTPMHLLEQSEDTTIGKIARGASAKRAASLMNYGNLIAILIPFPLLIFWFGASMLAYASRTAIIPILKWAITRSRRRTGFMASPAFSW